MEPQRVADCSCATGEGPLWHPSERRVYWVDIPAGRLFRLDPTTGEHEVVLDGDTIGGFTIQADGALLLFGDKGSVRRWHNGAASVVISRIDEECNTRFNDVIADPEGRVFCGTLGPGGGRLHRLDPDGRLTKLLDDIGCSNGMGFAPDGRGMYYTDSLAHEICLFDYDRGDGSISNRRVFVRTCDDVMPDGMTVDAEGFVWSAMWGGGCVVRYAPDGSEQCRIGLPARKVSSVTFGGDDYSDLYITTAGGDKRGEEGPGAGALFRADAGVGGVAEFVSRIDL